MADVVPLTGLNRAFVAKGLIAMRRRDHVGLTALMDVARLERPAEPGISASCSGRASTRAAGSGAPISACGCCWRTTSSEAARIAAELDRLNSERQ